MEQWTNLVKINQNFRKSVNLQLDLGDRERILSYIPTRSQTAVLRRYLEAVSGKTREGASILIGPYGKGKSHLLLVLLALLKGELPAELKEKIAALDPELNAYMELFGEKGKKYLPVLVSASRMADLNQSFLAALKEALEREQLGHLAPETYFSKAIETIQNWEKQYPAVYEKFCGCFREAEAGVRDCIRRLETQDKKTLEWFQHIYPELAAGSVFMPMMVSDALKIYRQMNRILTEECGYAGMFVVFDEFSKYIEGHETAGFAGDMKVLQDICELANQSGGSLFMTLVAHKSIHEYVRSIDVSVKNAFRGVEGRICEIPFVVSAQNHYELIADTIRKQEPEFSMVFSEMLKRPDFLQQMQSPFRFPCFSKVFTEDEYRKIIAKGCFPLTPATAYLLLRISEKAAQNERTVFTFLADDGQGCLPWLLQKSPDKIVGADKIYDYFKNLFRETYDTPQIHNEWLKAEYALSRTEDAAETAIIKALAVIRMANREDELPAKDMEICFAAGLAPSEYERAMEHLKQQEILVYRSNLGVYAFRNNVGVDVEKKISDKMAALRSRISFCETLARVCDMEFELPKQYNQQYAITRYFQYVYMTPEAFLGLEHTGYLFEETFSDGKMVALIDDSPVDGEAVQRQLDRLGDIRVLALVSENAFSLGELLLKYEAVRALKHDSKFIEENILLLQELQLCEEDIAFEINARMEADFLPGNGNVTVFQVKRERERCQTAAAFHGILSSICRQYYGYSPKINHELLNVEHIGSQYLRARNAVIKNILEGNDCSPYEKGTMPEAMVYRAAFLHTAGDRGCEIVNEKMEAFFGECAGNRRTFDRLYEQLQGEHIGARKGIIPLFLARKLADAEGTAVVYIGGKELEISAETLNHVNDFPEKYSLYLEPETAEKEAYLKTLEEMFGSGSSPSLSRQKRLGAVAAGMQKWYRALPQYAAVTEEFSPEELAPIRKKMPDAEERQAVKAVAELRSLLRRAELNPRELLFDKIPACFHAASYGETAELLSEVKKALSNKLNVLKAFTAAEVKKEFGISEKASLKAGLSEWHSLQAKTAENHVLTNTSHRFLAYLKQLESNDETEIVSRLSRILLDTYLEDWTDAAPERFREALHAVRSEVESAAGRQEKKGGANCIILKDADGNELKKTYEADISDSTSQYLSNMIGEALEEFGDALEKSQKVAVLVQKIRSLLG